MSNALPRERCGAEGRRYTVVMGNVVKEAIARVEGARVHRDDIRLPEPESEFLKAAFQKLECAENRLRKLDATLGPSF